MSGKVINFIMGGHTMCSGVTDANGNAGCTPTVGAALGTASYTARFAGDANFAPATANGPFT